MRSKRHFLIFRGRAGLTFAVCPLESNGDRESVYLILLFDFATQSYFMLQNL